MGDLITKNPLSTLFSTSEGLAFLAYMAMTIYGMLIGEVNYLEGLAALGGGTLGWGGLRTYAKKDDEAGDVKQRLLKVLEDLQESRNA